MGCECTRLETVFNDTSRTFGSNTVTVHELLQEVFKYSRRWVGYLADG